MVLQGALLRTPAPGQAREPVPLANSNRLNFETPKSDTQKAIHAFMSPTPMVLYMTICSASTLSYLSRSLCRGPGTHESKLLVRTLHRILQTKNALLNPSLLNFHFIIVRGRCQNTYRIRFYKLSQSKALFDLIGWKKIGFFW